MKWLTDRLSYEEKAELKQMTLRCMNEVSTTRGTPAALASAAGIFLLAKRGFFKNWGILPRTVFFTLTPVMVFVTVDLYCIRNHPGSIRVQERIKDLYAKYSTEPTQQFADGGRRTPRAGSGLTYAQLRDANRSGRPLKPMLGEPGTEGIPPTKDLRLRSQQQLSASGVPPMPDESYGTKWAKPGSQPMPTGGGFISGTPIGSGSNPAKQAMPDLYDTTASSASTGLEEIIPGLTEHRLEEDKYGDIGNAADTRRVPRGRGAERSSAPERGRPVSGGGGYSF